ncbi:hypothetical protein [Coralliovum pocilloporae]|uniref:hypothetical protein n=1 Tax=Coralliovum pocilloporae TaxID=3066369 RepID=UPI003306B7B0
MSDGPVYRHFLGAWVLDVDTCSFDQGSPPRAGTCRFEEEGDELIISMNWVDVEGEIHNMAFKGVPNADPAPFNGGELADALSMDAPSEIELNSSAYLKGVELMTARRTLSRDYTSMELVQRVILPDGTMPENRSTYRREN